MIDFVRALEGWGIPVIVLIGIAAIFIILQLIGLFMDTLGKSVPVIMSLFKKIKERKQAKQSNSAQLTTIMSTLTELKTKQDEVTEFLKEVKSHYDEDNIAKRDKWMLDVNTTLHWCKERGKIYDKSVGELTELADVVKTQTQALELNNKMTSELYKENTRSRILDFAHKLVNARESDKPVIFSREEFRKIYRSYEAYEDFLATYGGTNGQVDDAMEIVRRAERGELPNIQFLEDLRG